MIRDSEYIWLGPLTAMVLAQVLKPLFIMIRLRKWDWQRMRQSGGMPSSHSALVVALVTELWLREGGRDPVLAIAIFVAVVVMYDAAGVRWHTGRQAAVLNRLLHDLRGQSLQGGNPVRNVPVVVPGSETDTVVLQHQQNRTKSLPPNETTVVEGLRPFQVVKMPWWLVDWPVLNEHVGHKKIEVLGGCVVGVLVALYMH